MFTGTQADALAGTSYSVEAGYFRMAFRGPIAFDDYSSAAHAFLRDARVDADISGVLDLREAQLDTSFSEIAQFIATLGDVPRNTKGRIAIVADDPVVYGLSRTFAALQRIADELRVFTDHDEAIAWSRGAALLS